MALGYCSCMQTKRCSPYCDKNEKSVCSTDTAQNVKEYWKVSLDNPFRQQTKRKPLLDLCKTRWAERHYAYSHFFDSYLFVVESLDFISYGLHKDKYDLNFKEVERKVARISTPLQQDDTQDDGQEDQVGEPQESQQEPQEPSGVANRFTAIPIADNEMRRKQINHRKEKGCHGNG
ncbi:unnamed protein product [Mytilus edulis]|uniref:Uncharacterized protein n=1 Tax=Mytilus edulis TaxID=6550 RepID=A0A8S3SJ99_MYTED|nr:unnamed protein product [Mytilus edulis]